MIDSFFSFLPLVRADTASVVSAQTFLHLTITEMKEQ